MTPGWTMTEEACTHRLPDGSTAFECTHAQMTGGVMTSFVVCRLCGKEERTRQVVIPEKYLDRMAKNKMQRSIKSLTEVGR